jgi:thymidylate kinase
MSVETRPASDRQENFISIYGIPGSGKTFLVNHLKQRLENETFTFWDWPQVIATVVPGNPGAFHKLEEEEKRH